MKGLLVILVILVVVFAALTISSDDGRQTAATPVPQDLPVWRQPVPPGAKEVDPDQVLLNIEAVRRNKGKQSILEFHITEKHGYMVDGVRVDFWYRFKDDETGEWIDDTNTVEYFVKKRLGFNETLVDSTPLLDIEFKHLGTDLSTSTTENWGVKPIAFVRAMEPTD